MDVNLMENYRSYNPNDQNVEKEILEKISELYSHIFHLTNYVHFYDEKIYLGTENKPMNNGAKQHAIDSGEWIEYLIGNCNANQMYILCNIDNPLILSIGKFVQKIIDEMELEPIIKEIKRCLKIDQ